MSKKKRKRQNPDYEHIKGGDHQVPLPEHLAYLEEQGFKALKYGNTIFLIGPGYDTKVIDEILGKIKRQESVVIVITGPPGTGKTYLGIALAQILDERFHITDTPPPDPKEDHGQVTFERSHIMHLTGVNSPLKRGQVVLPDESHFGIGARKWMKTDQQELTDYVAAIRSKGYVLILVVLHTEMIDKMIRDFVINYEIHVTNRGEGVVYRRWFPQFSKEVYKKRIGRVRLPLPDYELCGYPTCLGCKHLNPKDETKRCKTIRAIYERRKEHFLNTRGKEREENGGAVKTPLSERIDMVWQQRHRLTRTSHNNVELSIIQQILEENGEANGTNIAREVQRGLKRLYRDDIGTLPIL